MSSPPPADAAGAAVPAPPVTLVGRTVVVIGGTSGIGRGVARAAAAAGARVVVAGSSPERLEEARRAVGPEARAGVADLFAPDSIAALYASLDAIDHLVVTAAPSHDAAPVTAPLDGPESYVRGKLLGTWAAVHHAVPRLPPDGSVLVTTGGMAVSPAPGRAIVTAVFGALEALVAALAVELAPVRVNAIRPGLVDTPLWASMPAAERDAFYADAARRIPAGRVAQPADVGAAAVALMTLPYVTGTVLPVDGGG